MFQCVYNENIKKQEHFLLHNKLEIMWKSYNLSFSFVCFISYSLFESGSDAKKKNKKKQKKQQQKKTRKKIKFPSEYQNNYSLDCACNSIHGFP